MKLKLVVASMSVLGLISCPVFAATQTKHKYHPKVHHKVVKHHEEAEHVAHTEVAPVQPAQAPCPICAIPQSYLILDGMTQNVGRAWPNPCNPGWFNRIAISGGINVDLGKWGNRNANYMGENYQHFSLNDAYINIAADVSEWSKAFASISYNTATINDPLFSTPTHHVAEFDAAYDGNILSGSVHKLDLEQAFITIGNFDMSPIFIQLGKQFQDFGRYEIHPITESLTQVMSKTLATSAEIGFIASGFHGDVYVFDDPLTKVGQTKRTTNYGAALGYDSPADCNQIGFDLGVAWLYNIIGVNDIAYQVNQYNINNSLIGFEEGYHTRVSGAAAYADLMVGNFYVGARYTTALKRFNVLDLPKHGTADIIPFPAVGFGAPFADATGAKPWSAGVNAGVGFCAFCDRPQTIFVGYQLSRQAAGLYIPKDRWVAGYGIDVWRNTNFTVEWDHDHAYSKGSGGTGNTTNLVTIRAAVKFS